MQVASDSQSVLLLFIYLVPIHNLIHSYHHVVSFSDRSCPSPPSNLSLLSHICFKYTSSNQHFFLDFIYRPCFMCHTDYWFDSQPVIFTRHIVGHIVMLINSRSSSSISFENIHTLPLICHFLFTFSWRRFMESFQIGIKNIPVDQYGSIYSVNRTCITGKFKNFPPIFDSLFYRS